MASRAPYRRTLTPAEVDRGKHRAMVGGLWDELGALQFEFMINRAGLTPQMMLLDLGCGSPRGGVRFIEYLDRGNYYGIDLNRSLVDAGRDVELPRYGIQHRLSPEQLLVADDFGAWRFGVEFDVAIAISLWTHLPLNQIEASLREVGRVLKPGGALYATIFLCDDEAKLFEPLRHEPGGMITHHDRDPYHYAWKHIKRVCAHLGLRAELLGDWSHPRAQQMVRVTTPAPRP